jgi:hypothetical protein
MSQQRGNNNYSISALPDKKALPKDSQTMLSQTKSMIALHLQNN